MTEEQKREAMKEFFVAPFPELAIRSIVIGGILILLGLVAMANQTVGAGLTALVIGSLWAAFLPLPSKDADEFDKRKQPAKSSLPLNEADEAAKRNHPTKQFSLVSFAKAQRRYAARPSQAEMLKWLDEDIQRIVNETLKHLNITETTGDAIYVLGPSYFDEVEGIDNALVLRKYVSNHYFYSTYRITVFQFTAKFLGAYQASYNMIRNVCTAEQTDEFFYKDIVAVQTRTDATSYMLKTGVKLERAKTFTLSASSGQAISVILNDPTIKAGPEIETIGDKAVNNIRAMLRQYKE
jgi:hypothetical protein